MKTLVVMLVLVASAYAGVDIGMDTIAGIPGTVDSGQAIVPGPVLFTATGGGPGEVYFEVIQHGAPICLDSSGFPHLNPNVTCTLALSRWAPPARESLQAVAWLHCSGDTYPHNDTFRQMFFMRVKDIAVTQIIVPQPDTVYDSGALVTPRCRVWNFGNVSQTFDVRFRIGAYQRMQSVSLIPGGSRVVTAPDHYTATPGVWACQVSAIVVGDLHPENNVMVDTFTVRGNLTVDVDARAVLVPPHVIDTTMTITPKGRFGNNGTDAVSFWAYFSIRNPGGAEIYAESSQAQVGPGDSVDIDYATIRFSDLGTYTAICSTAVPGDQNSTNDVVRETFYVVAQVITNDIGFTSMVVPHDTVDTLTTFHPSIGVKNSGTLPDSGYVVLVFSDTTHDGLVYEDSRFFKLSSGDSVNVDLDSVRFTTLGSHGGQCSFWTFYGGTDTTAWSFWVVPHVPGVEEGIKPQASSSKPQPTIVRGVLALRASGTRHTAYVAVLLDIAGRKVLTLESGPNDVSGLSPGVYFIATSGARSAGSVHKVVIGR